MNFEFNGQTEELVIIEDGFTFPSMSKKVQYHESGHSNRRRRRRSIREPFSFSVPLIVKNKGNTIDRDIVNSRLNQLLYTNGPKELRIRDSDWYMVGEFIGPYQLPTVINVFEIIEVEFVSEYSHKFYNLPRIQEGSTITIDTKSQLPTLPVIELTGLTGDDVQISNSKDDGSFKRIRLSGTLPSAVTIDPENETLYRADTGDERLDLLRIDSNFEDFTLEDGDVVTVNQGSAKLTYKELML